MDWQDVEAKLQERAEEVCRHLLPNGKREGAEYVIGNLDGKPGDSMKVNLAGKVGTWRDFAGDKGGKTLISLWCSVRSQLFKVCIVEAKQFLGIRDDFERRVRSYPSGQSGGQSEGQRKEEDSAWKAVAEVWARCAPLTVGGPVWEYLVGVRKIEAEMIEAYQVREMLSHGAWVMVFPYWAPAGDPDMGGMGKMGPMTPSWLKFEKLERTNGKKVEWTTKGPEKCLFGMRVQEAQWFKECRDVLICEGEKDALSWASYGCSAWGLLPVSVPFGAKWKGSEPGRPSPNREWLDRSWDWLQGFEQVFVAMDSDDAGKKAAADIIAEVGARRCRMVELPGK